MSANASPSRRRYSGPSFFSTSNQLMGSGDAVAGGLSLAYPIKGAV
ncbi:MAG: hypothetical protein RR212_04640 [Bacteroidales bacterium]